MDEIDFDFDEERAFINKDAHARRRYMRWFNKRREDFASDSQYDDYLEMVENIIYKLVNNIDVQQTMAEVEKYRRENQDLISLNSARKVEDDRLEAERIGKAERQRLAQLANIRKQDVEEEKQRQLRRRQEDAEELLRISKGDEALAKLRKKKEKKERKKRKKEAADARAAIQASKPDFQPMWFRPQFSNALPVPVGGGHVTADQRPEEDVSRATSAEEQTRAASAAGFRQKFVYQRALAEFEQSFSMLVMQDSET